MNRKSLLLLVFLPVAGGLWGRPKTDVLVMSNGDRFTCEIKKLERGVLYAGFDYVDGTVALQWSKVARVESAQLFIVYTESGVVYEGTLRTPEAPADKPVRIEVLEPLAEPEVMERRRIVEMAQTSESFWRRLSGNIDSGFIFTKGNNTTQYNIGTEIRFRREFWSGEAAYNSNLSKSSGVTASTRNQGQLGVRRLIGRNKWFYTGAAQLLQSSQQGIDLQTTLSGGIGKVLADTNRERISLSGGLAWQETEYSTPLASQASPNALAGWVGGNLHLFQFKKTALDVSISVLPVLTQAGRVRSYLNTDYSIQIVSNLWWKISFYGSWDNRPPISLPGSDYGTSGSISWSFN